MNPDADDGKNNQPAGIYGQFYITDNYLHNNPDVSKDNHSGIDMGSTFKKFAPDVTLSDVLSDKEFNTPHSRIKFPNIRKPISATERGDIIPVIIVTIIGNKIFVLLETFIPV